MNPTPVNPFESSATGTSGQAPTWQPPSGTCVGQMSSGSLKIGTADQPQSYGLAIAELEAKIEMVNANAVVNLQMGQLPQAQHDAERSLQLRKVLDMVKGASSKPKSTETNDIGIPVLPIADGGKAATSVSDICTLPIEVISAFAGSSIAAKMQQSKNDREMEDAHRSAMRSRALAEQLAVVWWKCSEIGATLQHLNPLKDARTFTVVCEKHGGQCFHADTPMAAWRAAEKWLMSPDRAYVGHLPEPLTLATKPGSIDLGVPRSQWAKGINIHPGNPSDLEPKSYLTTIGNTHVDKPTPNC